MTQAIATIENGKTWLPLLAVQRRSHAIGYHMPVRDHASAAEATAAALAARRRLRAGPVALPSPKMAATARSRVTPAPEPIEPGDAPLNMLGACSWRFLVALAAVRHGMSVDEVMRRCRQRHIIDARTDAIELIYRHTQYSMPGVGRIFELDHTSILNALIKTGSTDKLVEVLPHMDTARRSKNRGGIVLAIVEAQHA